jgi:hypothetical protein
MSSELFARAITLLSLSTGVTPKYLLGNDFQAHSEIPLPEIDDVADTGPGGQDGVSLRWLRQASAQGPFICTVGQNIEQILDHRYQINTDFDTFCNSAKEIKSAQSKEIVARSELKTRQDSVCTSLDRRKQKNPLLSQ